MMGGLLSIVQNKELEKKYSDLLDKHTNLTINNHNLNQRIDQLKSAMKDVDALYMDNKDKFESKIKNLTVSLQDEKKKLHDVSDLLKMKECELKKFKMDTLKIFEKVKVYHQTKTNHLVDILMNLNVSIFWLGNVRSKYEEAIVFMKQRLNNIIRDINKLHF